MSAAENQDTATVSIRLADIHDFAAKLMQPSLEGHLLEYVAWRKAVRAAQAGALDGAGGAAAGETSMPDMPRIGPISINLDLSTTCNYACTHCIDWDALNLPQRHDHEKLLQTLRELTARGLKSVIVLGGGEPTLYAGFHDVIRVMKEELKLQVAVVTNGSRNQHIAEIAHLFEKGDWVRLSLDAGSNGVFDAMHCPKQRGVTLDGICESARLIKQANANVQLGFSFVITWKGAQRDDQSVIENLHEMAMAAERARDFGFDYISFKPFLQRAEQGAEVLEPREAAEGRATVTQRIQEQLDLCKPLQSDSFRVVNSTNLRVLMSPDWKAFTDQPKVCHMQALRQVVSPLGVFNCPAHRGIAKARLGDANSWLPATSTSADASVAAPDAVASAPPPAQAATCDSLGSFDAHKECAQVTCLYHPVNHWIEGLIASDKEPEDLIDPGPEQHDYFL
jgi:molybdenum cofactor biosynthesis enzyme MoaA